AHQTLQPEQHRALAEAVMQSGGWVIGTFRQAEQVEAFNQTYAGQGFACQLDVTDSGQITAMARTVTERFGRVDVLVNNAGYGFAGSIEEASLAEIREVFEANFFGAIAVTQAFLPLFRRQQSGHIVQISSHSGFKGFAGFGVYGASKFALEGAS
ncbi:SDR family NAD(P)-dependent oxidoreductase, partial [Alistipes onderdonkii]|uniref:SDR family NAD(P)-dependent oxidoreductase n=1 Tax=Alistipes onderdonkii TaxID=328813 RepID=UPI001C378AEC